MRVIEAILKGIKDGEQLVSQMARSESISLLVAKYNDVISHIEIADTARSTYAVTPETYGGDFKRYISYLLPGDVYRLLEAYLAKEPQEIVIPVDIHATPRIEDPVVRDERRLKHSLVKMVVFASLVIVCGTIGAIVAIMVQTKTMPDNAFISTIMKSAVDIIKFVFNLK